MNWTGTTLSPEPVFLL